MLARFIHRRFSQGELTSWTVGVVTNERAVRKTQLPGFREPVGLIGRKCAETKDGPPGSPMTKYTLKRLGSPNDEATDLTEHQYTDAFDKTKEASLQKEKEKVPQYPLGPYIRAERPKSSGLLLLYPLDPLHPNEEADRPYIVPVEQGVIMGFAVSFPSNTDFENDGLDYMVNYVYTTMQDFDAE